MTPGQQIALQPALAQVLAEHLHHAAVRRHVVIRRQDRAPSTSRSVTSNNASSRFDAVSSGPNTRKFRRLGVQPHHVAQELAGDARRFGLDGARRRHRDGIVAEVGQCQVPQQQAAVGVRVRAHAPVALGRQGGELGQQPAVRVEQLLGPIAPHPLFEHVQMVRLGSQLAERHLVRAERAFDRLAVDDLRSGPAFRRAQHDHRPDRPLAKTAAARSC